MEELLEYVEEHKMVDLGILNEGLYLASKNGHDEIN